MSDEQPWVGEHSPVASAEDIFFCFRLLLDRLPHQEEWPGHSLLVGQDLSDVVSSYVNSLEFARRNLLAGESSEIVLSEIEGFQIYTAVDDLAVGRHIRAGVYEDHVTDIFKRYLRPGMGVVDVGANVGYFTLLSASIVGPAGYVLAVEPNAQNMKLLEASRRVNGFEQVELALTAAGRETGLLVLNPSFSNGTTSELSDSIEPLLASYVVPSFRLDDIVSEDRHIGFVKMDAEGAEYNVVQGFEKTIARCRPVIVSEFSPNLMLGISGSDPRGYLEWFTELGYSISVAAKDGDIEPCGGDVDAVIEIHKQSSMDHVDIIALPSS
jgi:FkbM family methyltransferase